MAFSDYISRIKAAYKAAYRRVTGTAKLSDVEAAVERGAPEVARVLAVGGMPRVTEEVRAAYVAGGNEPRLQIEFVPDNSFIEAMAREIRQRAQDDLYSAIMSAITMGAGSGKSPREIALDIIGRTDRMTGQRVGGVIGLSGFDAERVLDVYDMLRSGDPEQMGIYLNRKERQKLLDGIVKKAIEEGKAVGIRDSVRIQAAVAEIKADRYAELLASHNAHEAYNGGIFQVYERLTRQAKAPSSIEKIWVSKDDERVRRDHKSLNGQRIPLTEAFVTASGERLRFPGDSSLGATWSELANCRCTLSFRVRW